MTERREKVTMRRVPLRSREAGDARVEVSLNERLALVTTLSLSAWATTGQPLPEYTRDAIPVRRVRLGADRHRD